MDQILGSSSTDLLQQPRRGGRSANTLDRQKLDLSARIAGWGSDLDPAMRPGVPRDKAPDLGAECLYPAITPQRPHIKVHKSTEHARLTPVFGTSCPPAGLSGAVRDVAYRLSEGRLARWMLLMTADRINVVEDLAQDLRQMRLPNLPREMGLATEWRYNRAAFVRRLALATGVVLTVAMLARRGARSSG